MTTRMSNKAAAKKAAKRLRKSNQKNSTGKRIKIEQPKRRVETAIKINNCEDKYRKALQDDDKSFDEMYNGKFFRAPEVIQDNNTTDDDDMIADDNKKEKRNDIHKDYDFMNGQSEKLINAHIVETRAMPEYNEFDVDDEESSDFSLEQLSEAEEDAEDVSEDASEEQETDDDADDQQSREVEAISPAFNDDDSVADDSLELEEIEDTLLEEETPNGEATRVPLHNSTAYFYAQPKAEETLPELSIFENSLKTNKVLAVLKQDMEWYGTLIVTLLSGRISINGYEARQQEPITIYSPKGLNWVVISPKPTKKTPKVAFNFNNNSELEESFTRSQLENILSNFDSKRDAIVLLQRNSGAQKMLNTFGKHMAENVFPTVNASNRPHYASEYLLNCLVQRVEDPTQGLQVPKVWTKLALQPNSRLMITGGKGVGKSTLLRYLVNRHLPQFGSVLLVDLDIGQPELFVPQTVSCSVLDAPLVGPGFFLNRQPDKAFAVGHVNVVMCAEQYAHAVKSLLSYCREQQRYKQMPWLINTMGYNKGFGVELIALLVDAVQPTALVQISSHRPINNFDVSLDSATLSQVEPTIYVDDEFKLSLPLPRYTMHKLDSVVPQLQQGQIKSWRMSAKDMRYSNVLARLSATLRGNAKYLTECQPLKLSLDELQFKQLTSEEYTREELIAGAEVNMVYLCKQPMNDNKTVECLGIGVVRAIDYETNTLYLLPAMPLERCSDVNCLVIGGDMCLPQGFIKDQGAGVANNVPFVFVIDDSKSSKSVQQIYHRAPGFLGNPANKNV